MILRIQIPPLPLQAVFSTKTISVHRFICKQDWETSCLQIQGFGTLTTNSRHSRQDIPRSMEGYKYMLKFHQIQPEIAK